MGHHLYQLTVCYIGRVRSKIGDGIQCNLIMGPLLLTQFTSDCGMHYSDDIMGAVASQITSLSIVYSTVYSSTDQKKTSKLRVTGICAGNSPVTGEFPTQMTTHVENVSIWWRHHWCSKSYMPWHQWRFSFSIIEVRTRISNCIP